MTAEDLTPLLVFVAIVAGMFWLLSMISNRNSQAEERLERIGRPKSLVDIEMAQAETRSRFAGLQGRVLATSAAAMEPQTELEKNTLKIKLANAGFRSETRPRRSTTGIRVAVPGRVPRSRPWSSSCSKTASP